MAKRIPYITTFCINCREEFNRPTKDLGRDDKQICPDCIDLFKCCKCGKQEPEVELMHSNDIDAVWCVGCADAAADYENSRQEEGE